LWPDWNRWTRSRVHLILGHVTCDVIKISFNIGTFCRVIISKLIYYSCIYLCYFLVNMLGLNILIVICESNSKICSNSNIVADNDWPDCEIKLWRFGPSYRFVVGERVGQINVPLTRSHHQQTIDNKTIQKHFSLILGK
jgi:ABC-type siderophore export system fused ATPase/permease subunit